MYRTRYREVQIIITSVSKDCETGDNAFSRKHSVGLRGHMVVGPRSAVDYYGTLRDENNRKFSGRFPGKST